MPVDYSKWDALELSDDSDIEVHPNVDKRSFIRAKQNQIHQARFERKNQIETYKYERIINDGLLKRINALLAALQSHNKEIQSRSPDELVFQAIMESVSASDGDQPPPPPVGVHTQEKEPTSYSKMMAALVDQVKSKVDEDKPADADRFEAYVKEITSHKTKVEGLQTQLLAELNRLEVEEAKKITSEGLHDGFNSSHVTKADTIASTTEVKKTKNDKIQAVEVLNPNVLAARDPDGTQSSGADADVDEPDADEEDDEETEPTELGKAFSKIKIGDYRASLQYISAHPPVLAERETDALLVMAFNNCMDGKEDFARQCVHQGLLLQYCRALGKDGVGLFFKRITTQGHQAQKVFFDDVNSTFQKIKYRSKELEKQRAQQEADGRGGVEQIQLHAVDPGTSINITIPPATSENPEEIKARELFEAFPPGLQKALKSGSLDEVNKVLGKMSVEEAEEVVAQLGEGGMLSLEEQIIDATTEEGQAALKDFEEQERAAAKANAASLSNYSEDPE